ncbi:hypothetical protein HOLleu_21376 [Holothuria leucospilota]|uniref:NACHT domain-containing protein n=1 Tax=Holothuria leucospilota TaxID=206669 RepID=A0A9Q1BXF1_HOLLE|nr:hypothetical protein HOLleu_21376 [Holothuria leucospilota]
MCVSLLFSLLLSQAEIFSYNILKEHVALTFVKDECIKLANFFAIPTEKIDPGCTSNTFADKFLLALEEKNILQPLDVKRFKDALVKLKINPSCITLTNIFERSRILPTTYERFLVTLSAHLTASLSDYLLTTFNISDQNKTRITSSQNADLSLLLSLDEIGVIGPLNVVRLIQPFKEFNLVQALATIYNYQTTVENLNTVLHKETQLKVEGKTAVFIQYLQKRIKSWHETLSPIPWKKSCKWKSTDLFVASGLFLTDSKAKNIHLDIDGQCKLEYTEIFTHERLKNEHRIILVGEPGSGKTMLMSQLAYDWCQGKFSDIKVFILLPLKFVQHRTIAAAVKDFYLPEDDHFSVDDIQGFLQDSENPAHLLLDGLEEYTCVAHAGKQSEIVQIMSKVKYPSCKAVISSRSDYAQNLPECPMLRLGKFGEEERNLYIKKILTGKEDDHLEINKFINDSSFMLDFCSVPLLFVMIVHNFKHMLRPPKDTLDMMSPLMKGLIEILSSSTALTNNATWRLNVKSGTGYLQKKGAEGGEEIQHNRTVQSATSFQSHMVEEFDKYVRSTLSQQTQNLQTSKYFTNKDSDIKHDHLLTVEELAFNGLCRGVQQLSWQREFVEKNVKNSRLWISSGILVVAEEVPTALTFNTATCRRSHLLKVPENSNKPLNSKISLGTDFSKGSLPLIKQGNGDISTKMSPNFKQGNKTSTDHTSGNENVYEISTEDCEHKEKHEMLDELTESGTEIGNDFEQFQLVKETERTTKKKHDPNCEDYELHTVSDMNAHGANIEAKDVKILSKVSLQVRFSHKLIQEWFAANHFSSMLWQSKASHNLQECVNTNLPHISPSDLHYILRFTCYLCPPSFHLVGKYLLQMHHTAIVKQREYFMECIFLCFAEYNGDHGAEFFEFLAALCQETICVRSWDSRLLQKAKCGVMELASKHWVCSCYFFNVFLQLSSYC